MTAGPGRLLRTIRLDASDGFVFDRAAEPGEWAVVGSFLFWDADPSLLEGKRRAAFRCGFLGIASFGWSTLAVVAEADAAERAAAERQLAAALVARLGAPGQDVALPAAREELAFAASLAEHPPGTLVALHRRAEGGAVRERFRTLRPAGKIEHARAFAFLSQEDAGAGEAAPPPEETVDLLGLAGRRP